MTYEYQFPEPYNDASNYQTSRRAYLAKDATGRQTICTGTDKLSPLQGAFPCFEYVLLHFLITECLTSDRVRRIGIAVEPRTWFGNTYGTDVSSFGTVLNNYFIGALGYGIAMSSAPTSPPRTTPFLVPLRSLAPRVPVRVKLVGRGNWPGTATLSVYVVPRNSSHRWPLH